MLDYIDIKHKPANEVVCEYSLEPSKISLRQAAQEIAAESSIGTWTSVSTITPRIAHRLKPVVFEIKKDTIKIAYPSELFEAGNIPQILSSVAGNIFGMKIVKSLRLEDILFPKLMVSAFPGPRFGVSGIRKILRVKKRPLVGTIIKPKVGLNEKQHARVAYEAWVGGCDLVKDDENLTNQGFNSFEKRVKETLKMRDKAESETGERKAYMANVTAETLEMLRRAEFAKRLGNEYAMIDIITCGWSALQTLRNQNFGLVIHAHRAGHAAFTRGKTGISMLVIAKLARLAGVDQIHIGTAHVGKMQATAEEVMDVEDEIEKGFIHEKQHILEQHWHRIKPVLAVASGGLHPGLIPKVIRRMGTNIALQFGGGIHGHPNGTIAGAMAARQALEAALSNVSLNEYAKDHSELRRALKKWGQ
jgi:ribulose-bisphosphate carboxylase large chain